MVFIYQQIRIVGEEDMEQETVKRLINRRQYILCPKTIDCPFLHNLITINDTYYLYAHIDLPVTQYKQGNTSLVLLGDIFDYRNTRLGNLEILQELFEDEYQTLLRKLASYAGRFVLMYCQHKTLKIAHDAAAARKVFYGNNPDGTWLASQPYLLAKMAGLPESTDPSKVNFYHSQVFQKLNNSNIGNTTFFDDIFQLLPNHYLDLEQLKPVRYWPVNKLNRLTADEVADKCSVILTGIIESIANRYEVMVPITGGKDSRTIFSATHKISNKVYYYLNKELGLSEKSNDLVIPRHLLTRLKLTFNITDPFQITVDKDFERVYRENTGFPLESFLPHIYNYYLNYSNKVNLPGVFVGSAFELYGTYDKGITPEILARMNWVENYPHAVNYYKQWLAGCEDLCRQNNVNLFTLFYWEERMANWGTQVQLYKDIAQEDILPFNCREFIEYFFSTHPKYNDRPSYVLYRKIIERLWPEALFEPFNPGFKHSLFVILDKLGILGLTRKLRFIWIYKMH